MFKTRKGALETRISYLVVGELLHLGVDGGLLRGRDEDALALLEPLVEDLPHQLLVLVLEMALVLPQTPDLGLELLDPGGKHLERVVLLDGRGCAMQDPAASVLGEARVQQLDLETEMGITGLHLSLLFTY